MIQQNQKIRMIRLKDFPLDKASSYFAKEIAAQRGVNKVVLFPDSFTKEKYLHAGYKITIPSSSAIASQINYFYPQFRTRGINCGMTAMALPLRRDELSQKFINNLFNKILYSLFYYFSYRFRQPLITNHYDLSLNEFYSILEKGAKAYAEIHNLNPEDVKNIEFSGIFKEVNLKSAKIYLNNKWLNQRTIRLRNSFGRYFGGNHFFEIQTVENVNSNCKLSSVLKKDQVVIMYHTAGEALEDVVNQEWRNKYINIQNYQAIKPDNRAYQGFFTALNVAMNYGYAYRLATFAIINKAVKEIFGEQKECHLLLDKSHNHFRKENVNGQDMIIYRHNAECLLPKELAILSGNLDHPSYIVEGDDNMADCLYTIDHGLGGILEWSKDKGNNTDNEVKLYRYKKGIKAIGAKRVKRVPLVYNKFVDEYFKIMSENKILKPVVKLRPLINLKYL